MTKRGRINNRETSQVTKSFQVDQCFLWKTKGFAGSASGKESACYCRKCKRCRYIPWSGRPPGGRHGNPLQYSCLENPMDRGVWGATVHRVAKKWTQLKWLRMDKLDLFSFFKKEIKRKAGKIDEIRVFKHWTTGRTRLWCFHKLDVRKQLPGHDAESKTSNREILLHWRFSLSVLKKRSRGPTHLTPVLIIWHSCPGHHKLKQVLSRTLLLRQFYCENLEVDLLEKKHMRMVYKWELLASLSLRRKRMMWAHSRRQGMQRGGRSSGQRREERPQSFSVLQSNPGRVDHIHIPEVPYTMKQPPTFSISNYFKRVEGVILAQIRSLTIM